MSNRKLLLKARERAGIQSSTQTLKEDIRLFGHAIPGNFLDMNRLDFWRHFNKLYQTNGILTNIYIHQLDKEGVLQDYQVEVIKEFFPTFGE
jgi:hypothetical protein